jgi:hypothetical protein
MKRLLKARLPTITSPDPFVVTVDGKEVKFLEMDIAIFGMKTDRAYYVGPYTPGSKPICMSNDGQIGIEVTNKETGECLRKDCETCVFRTQQFRPCRQYGRAFIMDVKTGKFYIFQVPPKSLANLGAIEFEFEIKGLPVDQPIQCRISTSGKMVNFSNATVYEGDAPSFKFLGIEDRDIVVLELDTPESLLLANAIPDQTDNATDAIENHSQEVGITKVVKKVVEKEVA